MDAKNRICGACTACCKTHEVVEINKPAGVWCAHCEIGKGCRIYNERPQTCKSFRCLWLRGIGKGKDRPDRSKVVWGSGSTLVGKNIFVFSAIELRAGAVKNNFAQEVTEQILQQGQLVLHKLVSGERILYIPPNIHVSSDVLAFFEEENIGVQRK